jgi:UDP-N-acetylglucosamine pyrophosphorylase
VRQAWVLMMFSCSQCSEGFNRVETKMKAAGLSGSAIAAFKPGYFALASGKSGQISEDSISPASGFRALDKASEGGDPSIRAGVKPNEELLGQTVVLKLNGGLGTSMGLDNAKSLLKVKGDDAFMDFIVRQVQSLRKKYQQNVKFMLMNRCARLAHASADNHLSWLNLRPNS